MPTAMQELLMLLLLLQQHDAALAVASTTHGLFDIMQSRHNAA